MRALVQIYLDYAWQDAAVFESRAPSEIAKGYGGAGFLEYEADYAGRHLGAKDLQAASCRFPVDFSLHDLSRWPSFLLDLLPSGAARRFWLDELKIQDGPTADWTLLLRGAGNPPGNLRVISPEGTPEEPEPSKAHPGFARTDILERKERFLEYALSHGAPITGSTGAQGDAPKFLLTQDGRGRWHADGALADSLADQHWIVKFPRGRTKSDRTVLRNEAAYLALAKRLGLRVGKLPRFERDALFVPRFDRRRTSRGVERFGLESLCSAAGISEFGARISQEILAETIAALSSQPVADLLEFLARDLLNLAMGNTDNHARNSALLKTRDGKVRLSPLYDFAPMFLDPGGITRVCRWEHAETPGDLPDWKKVSEKYLELGVPASPLNRFWGDWERKLTRLPVAMRMSGVEAPVAKLLDHRIESLRRSLSRGKTKKT